MKIVYKKPENKTECLDLLKDAILQLHVRFDATKEYQGIIDKLKDVKKSRRKLYLFQESFQDTLKISKRNLILKADLKSLEEMEKRVKIVIKLINHYDRNYI